MPRTARPLSHYGKRNLIGDYVRVARLEQGITLEAVCGRIADVTNGRWIPISQDIYKIEAKRRSVTDIELLALAKALYRDVAWLLREEPADQQGASEI